MGGIIGIAVPVPVNRRKPTLRELARLIVVARQVEQMDIHAHRDHCGKHRALAIHASGAIMAMLPARYRKDAWMHAHIVAPAAREYARIEASS